jgi:hypothetical protein
MTARKTKPYSSWTEKGERKTAEELGVMAAEIIPLLSEAAKAAMLELADGAPGWRDAITARSDNSFGYELKTLGCISGCSRSGDNAAPFEPLGKVVRDELLANFAKNGENARKTSMFDVGTKVMIREKELPGYLAEFRRFVSGKVGTVLKAPYENRGHSFVEFKPKGRGRIRREWIDDRDLDVVT